MILWFRTYCADEDDRYIETRMKWRVCVDQRTASIDGAVVPVVDLVEIALICRDVG